MCGTGEMRYGEGHRYIGSWRDNKKHGYGVFTYFKGHIYAGDWIGEQSFVSIHTMHLCTLLCMVSSVDVIPLIQVHVSLISR